MVLGVGDKFNTLKKDGSKEDKVAVASGVAIGFVALLLVAWAIFFFKSIQRNPNQIQLNSSVPGEFVPGLSEAQKQLQEQFGNQQQDLEDIREQSYQGSGQVETQQMQLQGEEGGGFTQ